MLFKNTLELLLMASSVTAMGNSQKQTIYQRVNGTFVINIVSLLQQNIEFKNFIFYVSPSLYHETQEAALFINEIRHNFPVMPIMVITDNAREMLGLLNRPSLCFVMITSWNDPVLPITANSLNGYRDFQTIFLYFPLTNAQLKDEIHLLYHWLWERRFLNSMLITINNNLYVYEAYPLGIVINKTDDWQLDDILRQEESLDLKGWEMKTPVRKDVPRVFCMHRFPQKKRDSILSGTSGKLFIAFVKYINGSFNESEIAQHEFEPFESTQLLSVLEGDDLTVEISVHSYTSIYNNAVDTSYPVGINDLCLMVPFRNSSSANMFLLRSFQQSGWLMLVFAGFYITVGMWLCTPAPQRDVGLCFLVTVCSLLFIPPQKILIQAQIRLRFIFMLLFILGFCLTNMYLTKMATHLTAAKDEHQINTIQDVVAAQLQIMVSYKEHKLLLSLNFPEDFNKLMMPVNERLMVQHRESFLNTSYGYVITSDRWNFITKQQEFLDKPLFRRTKICIGPFYHVFPLQTNSDLTQPLKEFILEVQQSGLNAFWLNEAFNDALFLGYARILINDDQFVPLSLKFFYSILCVWLAGLLLSAFTFLWESRRVIIARGHQV